MSPNAYRIEAYEFGPFRLDLVVRQLLHQDKPIKLASRTFDILKILVENRGQVITKEEILRQVWLDQIVEENNLTVRMSALRKALGESAENRFIETVSGYGYRFVARVHEVFGEVARAQEEVFDSLAVLPLINESNQARLNYLSEGITESLITSLSQVANLRVMARSTVFRYKGIDIDPQKVGEELGVRVVLIGRISQANNLLVFDMEMIRVKDGVHIWGAKYRRPITDLIAFQEDLTRDVSKNLPVRLSRGEKNQILKRHTDDPQAYYLYLKGRYFWNKWSWYGVKKAIEYFRSAISYDPRYALAYVGLADTYIRAASFGMGPPRKAMRKAKTAALKALEIDDQLAEAHVSMGIIKSNFELDWAGANREFKLAIELNPYYAPAHHYYANLLVKVGQLNQALSEIHKAHEIDPLSLSINLAMGKIYYFDRRYEQAVKKGREILEIDPRFGPANGLVGMAYLEMGRNKEAIREFKALIGSSAGEYSVPGSEGRRARRKFVLLDSDPETIALLGYAYAAAGRRNKAVQILDDLVELIKQRYVQPHNLALVYIGLGDNNKAFEWLDRAFADRSSTLTLMKVAPFFERLREDHRYRDLVKRMGL